jgi:hypothetical protein
MNSPMTNIAIILISLIAIDLIVYFLLRNVKEPEGSYDGYVGFGFVMLFRRLMGKK